MHEAQYDVYFSGRLAEGVSEKQALDRLAQLFKSSPERLAHLFTGKPALIKRSVSRAEALKYREALQRAGMVAAFRESVPASPQTAAPGGGNDTAADLTLAPAGSAVLKPEERPRVTPVQVSTDHIKLASAFAQAEPSDVVDAPAPDTRHISLAPAGSDVLKPEERRQVAAPALDLSHYQLSPEGSDLSDPHPSLAIPEPDISELSLAPAGSDVLRPEERHSQPPVQVNTDHLHLKDSR